MAQKEKFASAAASQSSESFELVSFEDSRKVNHASPTVTETEIRRDDEVEFPWIDPEMLRLKHRIGRGPFGDLWIATHHVSTSDYDEYHEVAVKMLPPVKDDRHIQTILARFHQAFKKIQGLPHVCFLYGVTVKNGKNVCIAMKLYEGSIGDKLGQLKTGKLQLHDVLRYGVQLAEAVSNLHSVGVLVLNLKSCNFLLNEQDEAILGDIGIPSLLCGTSHCNPVFVRRFGTPNYMAPEQWEPSIRGPISYETDTWGFGCSVIEMLCGVQPWSGRTPNEIYQMVVEKQETPIIPNGLPSSIQDILHGCFQYDLRNRPLMSHILCIFKDPLTLYDVENLSINANLNINLSGTRNKSANTDWSLAKDCLQLGDIVRSRKANKACCQYENMEIPNGVVVGLEKENGHVLVKISGIYDPKRIHSSRLERVSYGLVAGDWVQMKVDDEKQSSVGILHCIDRGGKAHVGFLGLETLWTGSYTNIQMTSFFSVGQFVRLKETCNNVVSKPRFDWPFQIEGSVSWSTTGRISRILPNGCLVVSFPGRFVVGEATDFLADPAEVELVSFSTCEGLVKKFRHLEDFHWLVRPLWITLGLFMALKFGAFVRKKPHKIKQQKKSSRNAASWIPSDVANIFFREGGSSGDGSNSSPPR